MRHLVLRLSVGGVIVAALVAYLVIGGTQRSAVYYVTVGEFLGHKVDLSDKDLRVAGKVTSGSVSRTQGEMSIKFEIEDSTGSMPVFYTGAIPDLFKEGGNVVLEGRMVNGTFNATKILTKCPSKYESGEGG